MGPYEESRTYRKKSRPLTSFFFIFSPFRIICTATDDDAIDEEQFGKDFSFLLRKQ